MISSEPRIHCLNSTCSCPLNPISNKFCESCHTPLVYRYLWAADISAKLIPPGELVNERYQVIDAQIWLDTRPNLAPQVSDPLPEAIISLFTSLSSLFTLTTGVRLLVAVF